MAHPMPPYLPFLRAAPRVILAIAALGVPVVACGWPPTGSDDGGSGSTSAAPTPTTDPPTIVALNMNDSVATAVGDEYTLDGYVTYSDDDDVVTEYQVMVPVIGHTYTYPFPKPYASNGYAQYISFSLSADPPLGGAGATNYIITLVNSSGAVSQGSEQSADLE
jgi:hypothetical protein